ncbi:MAG: hypothetical protein JRI23_16225 [Deltaproteobacteria bacterium]|nr:hypothetical protein [Deltaproteobacteria bacterium]MBW2533318.1 hypothetical protein [Deltaproteobacteria bacterium]
METPTIVVPGLPPLKDADRAATWLRRAQELALEFVRDVYGDPIDEHCCPDCGFHPIDSTVVHITATEVWRHSRGRPCWSNLDVRAWIELVSRLTDGGMLDNMLLSLQAFYTFLVKFGHVRPGKARPIFRKLARHTVPIAQRHGLLDAQGRPTSRVFGPN